MLEGFLSVREFSNRRLGVRLDGDKQYLYVISNPKVSI